MFDKKLYLFNSMGREIQKFKSIQDKKVHLYSCGPTVYNYAHIGNLRAYIFVDILRRTLQLKNYDVLHVMNITDVGHLTSDADTGQDKMQMAAQREKKSIWDIAALYTEAFKQNLVDLNILAPSLWSYATDHIQEMIAFAKVLNEKHYTYVLEDGLYFDTARLKNYGALALLDVAGQKEGARVQTTQGKRNPSDFAVWRFSPRDKERLMEWYSPWGMGAPGWHLECSCMSLKYLGNRFDIHTGGIDHRQVHHCNEIAQNQAYLGDLDDPGGGVNYWLHNEFVIANEEKMSKSTGNFLTLASLQERGIHALVYRFFVLGATYRTPLLFTLDALSAAKNGLHRLLERIERLKHEADLHWLPVWRNYRSAHGGPFSTVVEYLLDLLPESALPWLEKLDAAIAQDLNTPQVLSLLFQLVSSSELSADALLRVVAIYDLVLGLDLLELKLDDLNIRPQGIRLSESEINAYIEQRYEARKMKDYQRADEIRAELLQYGIQLQDTPQGTTWEYLLD